MVIVIVLVLVCWLYGRPSLEKWLSRRWGRKKSTKRVANVVASFTTVLIMAGPAIFYTSTLPALSTSPPRLATYINGHPLEGYRMSVPVKKIGDNPIGFAFSTGQFEVREEGRKTSVQLSPIRLRLSQEGLVCFSPCTGLVEPGDRAYPSVTHFHAVSVAPGDKTFLPSMEFHSTVRPAKEISAILELGYGTSDPLKVHFTIVADGPYD